jgi:hypothetical protein
VPIRSKSYSASFGPTSTPSWKHLPSEFRRWRVIQYSESLEPQIPHNEIDNYLEGLRKAESALKDFLEDHSRVAPAVSAETDPWWSPAAPQQARITECHTAVNALPDTSAADEARNILSVAQDRHERLLQTTRIGKDQKARSSVAQKILNHYNATANKVLQGVYDKVAEDFSTYYRAINRKDEEKYVGKPTSEPAKLSFDVDFYGRGLFPPGAYHSEGHQT